MKDLKVIANGTCVVLWGDAKALVNAVCIRNKDTLQYEVVYWSGSSRMTAWVEPHEIQLVKSDDGNFNRTIGFYGNDTSNEDCKTVHPRTTGQRTKIH